MEFPNSHFLLCLFSQILYSCNYSPVLAPRSHSPNFPTDIHNLVCVADQTVGDFYLRCNVKFTYAAFSWMERPSCNTSQDSHSVTANSVRFDHPKLSCVSNQPIFLKTYFEDGIPREDLLDVQWKRIKENNTLSDFVNHSMYQYAIDIDHSNMRSTAIIKYVLFSENYSDNKIQILWRSQADYPIVFLSDEIRRGDIEIVATDEIVVIPCFFSNRSPQLYRQSVQAWSQQGTALQVDNSSLSYDMINGFKMNTSRFSNWKDSFTCWDISSNPSENIWIKIVKQPDVSASTQFYYSNLTSIKPPYYFASIKRDSSTIIYNYFDSTFAVTCSSSKNNITFETANAKYDGENNEVVVGRKSNMKGITYSHTDKPERTFTASVRVLSRLEWTYVWQKLFCSDPSTKTTLYEWEFHQRHVSVDTKSTPRPDNKTQIYDLYIDFSDDSLNCRVSSYKIANINWKSIEFRQFKCNNPFVCRQLAPAALMPLQATQVYDGSGCYPDYPNFLCKSLQRLQKGYFQCTAVGEDGVLKEIYQDFYFVGFDGKLYRGSDGEKATDSAILKMEMENQAESSPLAVPGNFTFTCEAHSFHFEHGIQWIFKYQNGTDKLIPLENIIDIPAPRKPSENNIFKKSSIYLDDTLVKQIICAAPPLSTLSFTGSTEWKYTAVNVNLEHAIAPTIILEDSKVKHFRIGERDQFIKCKADGFPRPEITWSIEEEGTVAGITTISGVNYKLLQFSVYNESMKGEYNCTAKNRAGSTKEIFTVDTKYETNGEEEDSPFNAWSIIAIVLAICMAILIPLSIIAIRRLRLQVQNLLTDDDIKDFREGKIDAVQNEYSPFSAPYNESYEVEKSQFEIDTKEMLGEGAFGIVYKGSVSKNDITETVAFKTVQSYCSAEQLKSLLSELKIMIYIGQHENVIRLVAAYTKEIKNGIIYIASELCTLGSLESFLRNLRKNDALDQTVEFSSANEKVDINSPNNISRTKLCAWAYQVANGMEYLASKRIIHADLATRNVLLNSDEMVKITDFGLSRKMYNYYNYKKDKAKKDPLPWKWMATETLSTLTFSTQSDVWSYGITIWEIFSLGAIPYPGIGWTFEFQEMLENGLRNPKPKLADSKIYSVMRSCWENKPSERPSFNSLKSFFMNQELHQENQDDVEAAPLYAVLE